MIMCPVEETGRNSVMPSMIAMIMLSRMLIIQWNGGEFFLTANLVEKILVAGECLISIFGKKKFLNGDYLARF